MLADYKQIEQPRRTKIEVPPWDASYEIKGAGEPGSSFDLSIDQLLPFVLPWFLVPQTLNCFVCLEDS